MMRQNDRKNVEILVCNPFGGIDLEFSLAAHQAGAFPVIKFDRSFNDNKETLPEFAKSLGAKFGIIIEETNAIAINDCENLEFVITNIQSKKIDPEKCIYQVTSVEEAIKADERNALGVILKGNESAGKVGDDTSFILFQKVIKRIKIPIWVQGGIGLHSSAALIVMGAKGVFLDDQLVLFPELRVEDKIKTLVRNLDGSETKIIHSYRLFVKPGEKLPIDNLSVKEFEKVYRDPNNKYILLPLSQDIASALYFYKKYKKLSHFIAAIRNSVVGHVRQAKYYKPLRPRNAFCEEIGIEYPFVQGPMTRVSDRPEFAVAVANAGGLPFLALSLVRGEPARQMLRETKNLMNGKSWGVGILGFVSAEIKYEQFKLIEEYRPHVVLIAGGRPSQAKPFEALGIKVFLHVPSIGLLDLFLKDDAKRFVFEGRECGGHVGPLSSLILWEKQIERLLEEEKPEELSVLFAGGIADSLSAAIISIMSAPLVARGVRVGILMGTAYLYTCEAVETGAILKQFQDQILDSSNTVLVETSLGHVTRCLNTPFVNFFEQEKRRLINSKEEKDKIWASLELLNNGRLRIAAKGIERQGDKLVHLNSEDQLKMGMYMIGQVATMHRPLTTMAVLHNEIVEGCERLLEAANVSMDQTANAHSLDVAIVGMATIFSKANDINEYWKNIVSGVQCISEVPDERWNKEIYYDPNSTDGAKTPSKWGGFISTTQFDPTEFGITPQSLHSIDPAQLLSLKVAKQALDDAGYAKKEFDRENTSVIFGIDANGSDLASSYNFRNSYPQLYGDIPEELDGQIPKMTEDSFPGVLANVVAGRIANRLDLGGRNCIVDAACASSLAALDIACQELVSHRSNMVLAGGVDLHNNISDYLMFSSTKALSRKSDYQTFDANSDGIVLGEGIAVVVLKRLEDAKRDGNKIYSVIKGIGASSDGKSLGLTAPRKRGQLTAFARAYQQAGIMPADVGLIETHGTGTVVGDKTELSSMTEFFIKNGAIKNQINLSSVKPQIGHTKCASGMAGLIKATLAVYYGVVPPIVNLKKPNKFYNQDTSPFVFNNESNIWTAPRRIAGVSAFGFGGTNFHAVVENFVREEPHTSILKSWPSELFVFRGDDFTEACIKLNEVNSILAVNDQINLRDIAYSLIPGTKKIQVTIVASDVNDLQRKIQSVLKTSFIPGVYKRKVLEGKVAFLFSGQGSQRVNMARDLFVNFPFFRKLLLLNPELEKVLFPASVYNDEDKKAQAESIKDTRLAQPLLGIVDYSIASFLKELGITPQMVAGHSYGEIPALCFAHVFNENKLVEISKKRADAIMNAVGQDPGAMLAVSCNEDRLLEIIIDHQEVYLANHNSYDQLVVSGSTIGIDKLLMKLKALNISCRKLDVACAFHSPLLAKSQEYFLKDLDSVVFQKAQIEVWSNTTATPYPTETKEIKFRLAEHLVRPVLFSSQIKHMAENDARIFIEVGPGKVLTHLVGNILQGTEYLKLNTELKDSNGITFLLDTLAQYIASGREINFEKLFDGREVQVIDLRTPQAHTLPKTSWNVNGHIAFPNNTLEPVKKMMTPKQKQESAQESNATTTNPVIDKLVQEYLINVRAVIQSQHDILMSYLGHSPNDRHTSITQHREVELFHRQDLDQIETPVSPPGSVSLADEMESVKSPAPQASQEKSRDKSKTSLTAIRDSLLMIVSEKTGYPVEMLGMDMDLESDLSIDSIKRGEIIGKLREMYKFMTSTSGAHQDDTFEVVTSIKTLNGLVTWISAYYDMREEKIETKPFSVVHAKDETSPATALTKEAIQATLLKAVSNKTGYPEEMLGMDMDLEADLSIDSIKRVEIIGNLKAQFAELDRMVSGNDEIVERLASIKTLNALVDWIYISTSPFPKAEPLDFKHQVNARKESVLPDVDHQILRLKFEFIKSEVAKAPIDYAANKKMAIAGIEAPHAQLFINILKENNLDVHLVSDADNLDDYEGFIYFDVSSFRSRQSTIKDLFKYVKKLDSKNVKWLYFVTDYKSELSHTECSNVLSRIQGFSGFINSVNKEWDARCLTINVEHGVSLKDLAAVTYQELQFKDEILQVLYSGTTRYVAQLKELARPNTPHALKLEKDDVVLVFGGAQGITAEIVLEMASKFPCHYFLVGRTPFPGGGVNDAYVHLRTKEDIKKKLVQEKRFSSPKELEKMTEDIFKGNQIIDVIKRIEERGARVTYKSLDLRDAQSVKNLMEDLHARYKKIDGIIHAAGYLADKYLINKTEESFDLVYSTKVNPLKAVLECLRPDMKFLVLFSSISSALGNKGQVDYASGNAVMDDYAHEIQKRFNVRTIAINWGPWKGKGMLSQALEDDFLRRGVTSIPVEVGVKAFMQELIHGDENQVILMSTPQVKHTHTPLLTLN